MEKRTNKLLSTLLTLALVLGIFAPGLTVYAGVVDSGDIDTDLTWSLDDAGVMTLAPKDAKSPAAMKDLTSVVDAPWYSHIGEIKSLIVKDGVTAIGDYAFDCAGALETVSLPKGLARIGTAAFFACEMLKELELPEGLTELGDYAFKACTNLKKATLPDGLKTIGEEMFSGCQALETVKLPADLKTIDSEAFRDCAKLSTIELPETLTKVGYDAFHDSALEELVLPAGVKEIFSRAFLSPELRRITVAPGNESFKAEENVLFSKDGKTLVHYPAKRESELSGLYTIPNGTEAVGRYAFSYVKRLYDVTVPPTVTTFEAGAFYECEDLEQLMFADAAHSALTTLEAHCFSGCTRLFTALPAFVAKLGSYCFQNCDRLTAFAVPSPVTTISDNAFDGCKNMTKIVLPGTVTSVELSAFSNCDALADVYFLGDSTAADALKASGISSGNVKLTDATWHYITDGVLATGTVTDSDVKWTVYASGLLEIEPNGPKTEIPDNECPWNVWSFAITALSIKDGVTSIGDYAFRHLSNLNGTATVPASVTRLGKYAFANCWNLDGVALPDTLTEIPEYCFIDCGSLKTVTVPKGVKSIGGFAFCDCSALKTVILPDTLETIRSDAFFQCVSLEEIDLPEGLTAIDDDAFAMCPSIKTLTLPKSLTTLGGRALVGTMHLENIFVAEGSERYVSEDGILFTADKKTLVCYPAGKAGATYTVPDGVTGFAFGAFNSNQSLTEIVFPDSLTELPSGAIQGCPIEHLALPENVTKIGIGAASNFILASESRDTLKSVYLPAAVTEIGEGAFSYNTKLTDVYYGGTEDQWLALKPHIDPNGNEELLAAAVHYSASADRKVVYDANSGTDAPEAQTELYYRPIVITGAKPTRSATVSFDACGGTVEPASVKRDATFTGWNTDKDGTGNAYTADMEYTPIEDLTLYAQWTLPEAGELPVPTREGYRFDGWHTEKDGGEPIAADRVVDGDLTAYAHWTEKAKYNVGFNANGGTDAPAALEKLEGDTVKLPDALPARSVTVTLDPCGGAVDPASVKLDAAFKDWNTDPDGKGASYAPGADYTNDESVTFYAIWDLPAAGELPVPVREGYEFKGWYNDPEGTHEIAADTVLHFDLTVYAKWTETEKFTVTFDMNGHGDPIAPQIVESGKTAEEPGAPSEFSYLFEGWFADEARTQAFDFSAPITQDTTVYAKWTWEDDRPRNKLSFETNGGSEIADQYVTIGGIPTKPADPTKDGFTFAGWFADAELKEGFDFSAEMTDDATAYAKWENVVPPEETTVPTEETTVPTEETTVPTEETTVPTEETTVPIEETTVPTEETTVPTEETTAPVDGYKLGDVNRDGKINSRDARLALRISAKLDTADDLTLRLADADRDGKVRSKDARLILRAAAKIEPLPDAIVPR